MAIINIDGWESVKANDGSLELIPAGWYRTMIVETDVLQTRDGLGQYVKAKLQIIEGEKKNRTVYHNFNTVNQSQMAQEIGRGQLKAVAALCGLQALRDTFELHNHPFWVRIACEKDKNDQNTWYNRIKEFKAEPPSNVAKGNASPACSAPAKKPWER